MDSIQEASKLSLSLDLVSQAKYQLQFLRATIQAGALRHRSNLRLAFYRYEKFWLPLAAEHSNERLSGPLDVEWMWHCHMLAPKLYKEDCKAVVNQVVDHTLKDGKQYSADQKRASILWAKKYPTEPFHPDYSKPFDEKVLEGFASKIKYDVVEAATRQGVFFYQVSLPHYSDEAFLKVSLQRYKQFLYLRTKTDCFITPCYDIDLLWHSHIVNPAIYAKDMERLLGYVFNHDDSVNDRNVDSPLIIAQKSTAELWQDLFGEPYASFGAMYRGYPFAGYFCQVPESDLTMCSKNLVMNIDEVKVQNSSGDFMSGEHVIEITRDECQNKKAVKTIPLSSCQNMNGSLIRRGVGEIPFSTADMKCLNFVIKKISKRMLILSKFETVATGSLDVIALLQEATNKLDGKGFAFAKEIDLQGTKMEISGKVTDVEPSTCVLTIHPGSFEPSTVPETVFKTWGPMPLEKLPQGRPNQCTVAVHRLVTCC